MDVRKIKEVEVYHEGRLVGFLSGPSDGAYTFVYSKDWIKNGFSISPFKLPLTNDVHVCCDYLVSSMFGVFYDCLPDSWGNLLVDKFLVKNGINPNELTILQRLTLLDESSLGSLVFKPRILETPKQDEPYDFDLLYAKMQKIIRDERLNDIDFLSLYHYGSSTGGSRPKANIQFSGEEYILKFPSMLDKPTIGEEEFALNELARQCGLNVNETKLIPSKSSGGYFAAKRFDRVNHRRVHVISLAGLFDLNPSLSQIHYLGFLQTVLAIAPNDLEEAVGRMLFNYFISNKDDHPRNFSFYYDEKQHTYRLTPFFDITSTPNIKEHMMLVNDTSEPTYNDFLSIIRKIRFDEDKFERMYSKIKSIVSKCKILK